MAFINDDYGISCHKIYLFQGDISEGDIDTALSNTASPSPRKRPPPIHITQDRNDLPPDLFYLATPDRRLVDKFLYDFRLLEEDHPLMEAPVTITDCLSTVDVTEFGNINSICRVPHSKASSVILGLTKSNTQPSAANVTGVARTTTDTNKEDPFALTLFLPPSQSTETEIQIIEFDPDNVTYTVLDSDEELLLSKQTSSEVNSAPGPSGHIPIHQPSKLKFNPKISAAKETAPLLLVEEEGVLQDTSEINATKLSRVSTAKRNSRKVKQKIEQANENLFKDDKQ